jgi:(1->4)-alpha-D-glucan 1-alpha-D-glucosylmutase
LLDWFPNHMGIDSEHNKLWDDVLEHGPRSRFADFFDIDWEPARRDLRGRVLLPILGDPYGTVLERGEIRVTLSSEGFRVCYFDHRLPLNQRATARLLEAGLLRLAACDPEGRRPRAWCSLRSWARRAESEEEAELSREGSDAWRLSQLLATLAPTRRARGDPARAERHAPRPSQRRCPDCCASRATACRGAWPPRINYRRFFDIDQLAAIRMERLPVFELTHEKLLSLLHEWQALRLDHTDGLYDPRGYFEQAAAFANGVANAAERDSPDDRARHCRCWWRRS